MCKAFRTPAVTSLPVWNSISALSLHTPFPESPLPEFRSASGDVRWVGCFKDDEHRDLKLGPRIKGYNTASCAKACSGFLYMALQDGGLCFCDHTYATSSKYRKMDDDECGALCEEEEQLAPPRYCGGPWRNGVYELQVPFIDQADIALVANAAGIPDAAALLAETLRQKRPCSSRLQPPTPPLCPGMIVRPNGARRYLENQSGQLRSRYTYSSAQVDKRVENSYSGKIWHTGSADKVIYCERHQMKKAPPPDYASFVAPSVQKVRFFAEVIAGDWYSAWSLAVDPEFAYGFYQAVKAAANAFPGVQELNYLEIGSNWGTSMSIVGELIRASGAQPGKLLSVDPYSRNGITDPEGVLNEVIEKPYSEAATLAVRERLRRFASVSEAEQIAMDELLNSSYEWGFPKATVHMVAAYTLYRALGLNVTHMRESSHTALPRLVANGSVKFHLAYIDGLHTEKQAFMDTVYAMGLLVPGAVLVTGDAQSEWAWPVNQALWRSLPHAQVFSMWDFDVFRLCGPEVA